MEDVNNPENRGKIALVNGGAMDYLMNTYLGADSTMASRTSLVQGWDQAFTDFFEEETTLYDAATGPAGGVAKRVWDKINVMSPYFGRYPLPNEFDDLTGQDILDTVGFMLSDAGELLLSPLSSASQLNRYIQMRNWNRLIDKRGGVVAGGATEEQFSVGTQIAALMGAKPNVLDEKYSLQEINRNTEKFIEYNTNQIMYSFTRYIIWLVLYPLPNEFDDLTGQDILDTVGFMLSDAGELLLSPLSSASQLNRYIQMRNWNRLIDKRGGVVAGGATEEQFSVGTQIAALMGAKPNVLDEKYSLQGESSNSPASDSMNPTVP